MTWSQLVNDEERGEKEKGEGLGCTVDQAALTQLCIQVPSLQVILLGSPS